MEEPQLDSEPVVDEEAVAVAVPCVPPPTPQPTRASKDPRTNKPRRKRKDTPRLDHEMQYDWMAHYKVLRNRAPEVDIVEIMRRVREEGLEEDMFRDSGESSGEEEEEKEAEPDVEAAALLQEQVDYVHKLEDTADVMTLMREMEKLDFGKSKAQKEH